MKLPDVNLLVYAMDESTPQHRRAGPWLREVLSGEKTVGLAWNVILGFLRISTRAQVFSVPFSTSEALDVVDGWLQQPNVVVVQPTARHPAILRGLLEAVGTAGNLTSDAHLAALAIEYGGEVCSADNDFRRFRGLRWTNPLDSLP